MLLMRVILIWMAFFMGFSEVVGCHIGGFNGRPLYKIATGSYCNVTMAMFELRSLIF
jgi:hypothetical protein